ncbi:MAG: hypothetical protein C0459_06760 [Chitinophaga sp.]|jgi:uncharacterized membrane protein YfbV (UPF0208 family)|nr:hypothetical protein [Chitinophaga sp.]
MLKKVITIFLLFTLSIQILPVQQLGKALFSNSFNEELPHANNINDLEKDCCKKLNSEFINWHQSFSQQIVIIKTLQYIHISEAVPHNHSTEILVPPPNC